MISLDAKTLSHSISLPLSTAVGVYPYFVYEYVDDDEEKLIFAGNFYYDKSSSYARIDVTDIVRNRKEFPNIDSEFNCQSADLIKRFRTKIKIGNNTYTSSWYPIAMVYRYPHRLSYTDVDTVYFYAPTYQAYTNQHTVPLQGMENGGRKFYLVPHYPLKETYNYYFTQAFITAGPTSSFNITVEGGSYGEDVLIDNEYSYYGNGKLSRVYTCALADFVKWEFDIGGEDVPASDFWRDRDLVVYSPDYYDITIAVLDNCYSHYYLMWQDRLGGYQSQAFSDKMVYSENITSTESINYKGERKKIGIQVQPKWKLNSGWIDEKAYPMYESIFVSPFVKLYDAYEDKIYDVIVNGNYTEKKFINEKKMLNISLDLESISKQNIIY